MRTAGPKPRARRALLAALLAGTWVAGGQLAMAGEHATAREWNRTDFTLGRDSFVLSHNESGAVAGFQSSGSRMNAFVAYPGQSPGIIELGDRSAATDINESGTVAGTYWVGSQPRGFVKEEGKPADSIQLGLATEVYSINDSGTIAGYLRTDQGRQVGFVMEPDEPAQLVDLGDGTIVTSVNDDGVAAGNSWIGSRSFGFVKELEEPARLIELGDTTRVAALNDSEDVAGVFQAGGTVKGFYKESGEAPEIIELNQIDITDLDDEGTLVGSYRPGFGRIGLLLEEGEAHEEITFGVDTQIESVHDGESVAGSFHDGRRWHGFLAWRGDPDWDED